MAWGPVSRLLGDLVGSPSQGCIPEDEKCLRVSSDGQNGDWRRGQEIRAQLGSDLVKDAAQRCGLVYDAQMLRHCGPEEHPERPERISAIWQHIQDAGLADACARVPARKASKRELMYVHSARHVEKVLNSTALCARQYSTARQMADRANDADASQGGKPACIDFEEDTYISHGSADAARMSAGCVLSLIDEVMLGDQPLHCGMAVVRPPGHHAKADHTAGFCLFNNVAIAARYLQKEHRVRKVLIVDWDVHHGDGTSEIFAADSDVLFFSVHRYDPKGFFPGTGMLEDVGKDPAKGYTVNVPLGQGYTDVDVCHAIRYNLVPLVAKFKPEFILVSAGFDAVHDDPLGGCHMTPQGFGWMTRCLYHLAQQHCAGRMALVLEGGYNCTNAARSATECVASLVLEIAGAPPLPNALPPLPGLAGQDAQQDHSCENARRWMPCPKTIGTVRKVSELHNLFKLHMPLAPDVSRLTSPAKRGKQPPPSRNKTSPPPSSATPAPAAEGQRIPNTVDAKQQAAGGHEAKRHDHPPPLENGAKALHRPCKTWIMEAFVVLLIAVLIRRWTYSNFLMEEESTGRERIFVQFLKGGQIQLQLRPLTTIGMLKAAVEAQEPTALRSQQQLIFRGHELNDSSTVSDYNIGDGSLIHCELRDSGQKRENARQPKQKAAKQKESEKKDVQIIHASGDPGAADQAKNDEQKAAKQNENQNKQVKTEQTPPQHDLPPQQTYQDVVPTSPSRPKAGDQIDNTPVRREQALVDPNKVVDPNSAPRKYKKDFIPTTPSRPQAARPKDVINNQVKKDQASGGSGAPPKPRKDFIPTTPSRPPPAKQKQIQAAPPAGNAGSSTGRGKGGVARGDGARKEEDVKAAQAYYIKPATDASEVWVFFPIARAVKSKDVKISFTTASLNVRIGGVAVADGTLWKPVQAEESFWEIGSDQGKRSVRVTLKKLRAADTFDQLLQPAAPPK
eukprot:TRINITY_DN27397_c0_g1_i1.p1 TRINITY_DN27397_c0_g1~~TRINITY_DN27397_c0_g1_i1.p1  ORF type:complete len:962 (+),score=178.67 TRINITY_DN27397_c0_g1_i1:17-2902(+)